MSVGNQYAGVHDPLLTRIAVEYGQSLDFLTVARGAIPGIPSQSFTGTYLRGDKNWLEKRSAGPIGAHGRASEIVITQSQVNFQIEPQALVAPLSEMDLVTSAVSGPFELRSKLVKILTQNMFILFEESILNFLSGELTTAGRTSTPATKWDASGGDPIADVLSAKGNLLMRPTDMIMSYETFLKLQNNAAVLDKIKYSSTGVVTLDLLQQLFDVDRVWVNEWKYWNPATSAFVPLLTDNVYIYHSDAGGLESNTFAFYLWEGSAPVDVWTWMDASRGVQGGSEMIKAESRTEPAIGVIEQGWLITNVLT